MYKTCALLAILCISVDCGVKLVHILQKNSERNSHLHLTRLPFAPKENAPTTPFILRMDLKQCSSHIKPFLGRSDVLTKTKVPVGSNPRSWYMEDPSSVLPPCISSSEFVPSILIEHLMRKKKDRALGVKFELRRAPPDAITNMEGAMHTYVTPIVLGVLHGDYVYNHSHGITRFPSTGSSSTFSVKMQQARTVLISAQIQPDFEGPDVLLAACALRRDAVVGQPLAADFSIPDASSKQNSSGRAAYDALLQRHMVAHLTQGKLLPSVHEVAAQTMDLSKVIALLESLIRPPTSKSFDRLREVYVRLRKGSILSLEFLFNSAVHQVRNELSALEALCPQGYVYTSDPPAIFARQIGAEILNRLQFAALKYLASANNFSSLRAFGFNDYADPDAVDLLKAALSTQSHVQVVPKSALFKGPKSTYSALPGTEGALLVIHNNSDGFGQNIETEWESGSMDGAIGANSSAAASLHRARPDLVAHLM